ncbi:SAV0927 family protein [Bacillus thuringiensis]
MVVDMESNKFGIMGGEDLKEGGYLEEGFCMSEEIGEELG